jgi:Trk-type K+ transport system membrane component
VTAGLPGVGLSGLFFVVSALLMVAVELVRTARGRSSLSRWRFVGRQAAIAAAIVVFTIAALWALELSLPGDPRELGGWAPGKD